MTKYQIEIHPNQWRHNIATIEVPGVIPDAVDPHAQLIQVVPLPECRTLTALCGVKASTALDNALIFTANFAPHSVVRFYIFIENKK